MWKNVMRGAEDQFDKHSLRHLNMLNAPYDYSSIMHYGPYAFSGNGRRTIIALKPGAGRMGQRESLSEIDIRKINKLYSCSEKSGDKIIDENSTDDEAEITKPIVPFKPSDECTDKSWRCIIWSLPLFDYCSSSKTIAYDLCPKSCGTCSDQLTDKPATLTTSTTTAKTTIKPKIESIILGLPSELAANINNGAAKMRYLTTTTIPRYSTKFTRTLTSNFGSTTATICRDLDYSCPLLVRIIDCNSLFSRYSMKIVCPLSCGLCPNNNVSNNNNSDNNNNNNSDNNNKAPKKLEKLCKDKGSYITCKLVLFFNECDENMNLCAKTCGGC